MIDLVQVRKTYRKTLSHMVTSRNYSDEATLILINSIIFTYYVNKTNINLQFFLMDQLKNTDVKTFLEYIKILVMKSTQNSYGTSMSNCNFEHIPISKRITLEYMMLFICFIYNL